MSKMLIRGSFGALRWVLCGVGAVALLLTAMVAAPLVRPPELASISAARKSMDFSALPELTRFQARDGTELAYRHYPAHAPVTGRIAVVVHGSSGSSKGPIHALSLALAARGVQTYAVDIRGHGASGNRGDISYLGQLEDDMADLVGEIRKADPTAPLTLIGHSSGGGFALRIAGSPIQNLFTRTVLLAPYLGYDAPSSRPNSGGWANADIPRFLALSVLHRVGMPWAESLPTIAFAVPPDSDLRLTGVYSYRLMRNFANHADFRSDLAAATRPLTITSGADDELMIADKYAEEVRGIVPAVDVKLIDGVNHMGVVSDPKAVSAIADDVAKADLNS